MKDNEYLWDGSEPRDPEIARIESILAPLRHDAPLDELRVYRRKRSRMGWIVAGTAVAAAAALLVWWRLPRGSEGVVDAAAPVVAACSTGTGFQFTAEGGTVACGGGAVEKGVLPVGGTLDTTSATTTHLAIADIGRAELGRDTVVRLDKTSKERHELFLERGHLHAHVNAPPRLFAVATPSADVTDLGCEYVLDLARDGSGTIEVVTGKVELASKNGVVVMPAKTKAHLLPGRRPGLPLVPNSSIELVAAVEKFERGGGFDDVLAYATDREALTVANLVEIVAPADKPRVLKALQQLSAAPQNVSIEDALSDRMLWEMWRDDVALKFVTQAPWSGGDHR